MEVHHGVASRSGQRSHSDQASLAFCILCAERELLRADGTWVCGIGRLWGATPIFGWVQRQSWLSLAPHQQVQTGYQVLELLVGGLPELLVGEQSLIFG